MPHRSGSLLPEVMIIVDRLCVPWETRLAAGERFYTTTFNSTTVYFQ